MIITAIEKKRKGLSLIYIDGEPAIHIDTQALLVSPYGVGSEINDSQLRDLITSSDTKRAYERSLYLIGFKNRSRNELIRKLEDASFSKDSACAAADKLERLGLLDDRGFAAGFADSLITYKGYGIRRVRRELKLKGISTDIIDLVLEQYSGDNVHDKISGILSRKYPAAVSDEKVRRRAVAALQRLGYSYDDIRCVLGAAIEE